MRRWQKLERAKKWKNLLSWLRNGSQWKKKVNGKGETKMLYDTIIPAFGFLAVCLLIYREAQKW